MGDQYRADSVDAAIPHVGWTGTGRRATANRASRDICSQYQA